MVKPLQHARERIACIREPIQPADLEPLKVLQRGDGPFIVYDPSLPLGRRTASAHAVYEDAVDAARIRGKR
jgi:hypothetical protein